MSNFNERHPPMGSEKDTDHQTTSNISSRSQYAAHSSSSSDEEPDELSLRVRALLAENDDEIPEFSSPKESPVHQVSQVSPQFDETGFDSQAAKNFECPHHADKVFFPKEEKEQVTESHTNMKDSTSKTDTVYDMCETLSYSYSTEVLEQKKVSFEEVTERYMSDDVCSGSDVTIIEDSHPDILQPSVKSHEEHKISKDSASYYPVDYSLEKQHVDYHLKEKCCRANLPLLDSSFSSGTQLFYYTPCEDEEKLSADKKSDFSSYSSARFSPQQSGDKECPWYSDRDTPSLSVSSIASSKRLEWDNAADIGYVEGTVDENNPQKKSRREPEGFSLAAHKFTYSASPKYSKTATQQLSAKDTSIISEREYPSMVSQSLDLHDRSHTSEGSVSSIEDKSVDKETLQYSSAQSSMVTESISDSRKEPKLQIHPDFWSVRPKDITYVKKGRNYGRRSFLPKDQSFVSERNTEYLKDRDSEMSKKKVSIIPGKTFEGNVNIVSFVKPEDTTTVRSFEPQPYQPISDLPEEYQRRILSGPVYIDSSMLASSEYDSRPVADNPISSSDVLPHIRWYPIPSYRSSQDIRNASTQTSVRQSNEAGTSSEIHDESEEIFVESSDVVKHLHMTGAIDRNPVNLYSLPPLWHSSEDVKSAAQFTSKYADDSDMRLCSNVSANADVSREIAMSLKDIELSQNVKQSSDVSREIIMSLEDIELSPNVKQSSDMVERRHMDFENVIIGAIKMGSNVSADAATSVLPFDSNTNPADSSGYQSFIDSEKDNQEVIDKDKQQVIDKGKQQVIDKGKQQVIDKDKQQVIDKDKQQVIDKDRQQVIVKDRQQVIVKDRQQVIDKDRQQVIDKDKQQVKDIPTVVKTKDASVQVKNCGCLDEFKQMLKKALNKVPAERVCPLHKHLMKELQIQRPSKRIPFTSEGYDVLFLNDDNPKVVEAEKSPLYFCSAFTRPMTRFHKKSPTKKLPEKVKQRTRQEIKEIEEKKKILRMLYRKKAKAFSKQLARLARNGQVDHTWNERILKKSSRY